jgi:methionyl-tRNA synthetase
MLQTFIKPGLEDLCVSRTSFYWGVKVKENPKHVVYVWLDALTNYITALGYDSKDETLFKKFWEDPQAEIVHIVGSDITRFHVIYWPIFLMALGLRIPDRVVAHGLLMMKDGKMSKSKGNVIDPIPLIERYGADTLRYYIVRETIFGQDGQFSPEQFVERTNMDLVNDFGNLLNRSNNMVQKYFQGVVPSYKEDISLFDQQMTKIIESTHIEYKQLMDNLQITEAMVKVNQLVSRANKYIDESQPWVIAKDPSRVNELAVVMNHLIQVLLVSGTYYAPILVESAPKYFSQLGIEETPSFQDIQNIRYATGLVLNKPLPLFPRLDALIEVPYIQSTIQTKK